MFKTLLFNRAFELHFSVVFGYSISPTQTSERLSTLYDGRYYIVKSLFKNLMSSKHGGAIFIDPYSPKSLSYETNSVLMTEHCGFIHCTAAQQGGAVYMQSTWDYAHRSDCAYDCSAGIGSFNCANIISGSNIKNSFNYSSFCQNGGGNINYQMGAAVVLWANNISNNNVKGCVSLFQTYYASSRSPQIDILYYNNNTAGTGVISLHGFTKIDHLYCIGNKITETDSSLLSINGGLKISFSEFLENEVSKFIDKNDEEKVIFYNCKIDMPCDNPFVEIRKDSSQARIPLNLFIYYYDCDILVENTPSTFIENGYTMPSSDYRTPTINWGEIDLKDQIRFVEIFEYVIYGFYGLLGILSIIIIALTILLVKKNKRKNDSSDSIGEIPSNNDSDSLLNNTSPEESNSNNNEDSPIFIGNQ